MARLPTETLRLVTHDMVDRAVATLLSGVLHNFSGSRDYDVLLETGERLAPKAVFGLALSEVIVRPARPEDFVGGRGHPSFEIIESAGYPIVEKDAGIISASIEPDEEREWAEGKPKMLLHLRKERASGLAAAKKRRFILEHGRLSCERCKLIPSNTLGPSGDACIEVHHKVVGISAMKSGHKTRLADLACVCANCHRIMHRELA